MCFISRRKANWQTAEAVERLICVDNKMLSERDEKIKRQEKLLLDKQEEIDELIKSNGVLKRELHDTKRDLNDRIGVIDEQNSLISSMKETIDMLCEKIENHSCPADCTLKSNPNGCRTCTRYPHAKDKYVPTK